MLSVPLLHFQSMVPKGWNCIFKNLCPTLEQQLKNIILCCLSETMRNYLPFLLLYLKKAGAGHCCCYFSVLGWMVTFLRIERSVYMKLNVSHEANTNWWKVSLNPVKTCKRENGRREQDKGIHAIWKYLFLMHSESEPASTQINWKNTCSCELKINLVTMNFTWPLCKMLQCVLRGSAGWFSYLPASPPVPRWGLSP